MSQLEDDGQKKKREYATLEDGRGGEPLRPIVERER